MIPSKNSSSANLLFSTVVHKTFSDGATVAVALIGMLAASTGYGASASFTAAPADANFATGANWSTGAAPGSTASNNDVATFNTPLAPNTTTGTGTFGGTDNPIVIDTGRVVGSITFDTANVGAYQIGTTTGNTLALGANLAVGNLVQLTSTVTSAQILAAPIFLRNQAGSNNPTYGFRNNAASPAATLTLSGAQTWNGSASRPTFVVLDGTNTGANIITGNIADPSNAQGGNQLTKNGTGTWILAGTDTFTGTAAAGIAINGGILGIQSALALGTGPNNNQVAINSTGTLQLGAGITLAQAALKLNLNNGGAIQTSGSASNGTSAIVVSTAATSVTLATVNASDIFTVGGAANGFTGGTAGTTVTNIAGPGTILLSQASNYAGSFSINSGTERLGNVTSLGPAASAAVAFGAGSTGRLQLFGFSPAIVGLNTNATTPGNVIIENGAAGTSTLTVGGTAANTYGGVLQDGAAGVLALVQSGTGSLTLTSANTFSGGTTISNGRIYVDNTTGSGLGSGAVNVTNGAIGGNGTVSGAVTVAGRLTPGASGTGSFGNLTVGSLTLGASSILTYDIQSTSVLDQITVASSGGLTINGGRLDINGATGTFTTAGVYNLIGYNGTVGGTGVSALTLNSTNKDTTNDTYTFGLSGSYVTLTIAASGAVVDYYTPDANSVYSNPANWSTGTPPNAVGAFAGFGGNGSAPLTANRTLTVDGAYTVGTLSFNSTTGFGYTLASGGAGTGLTLNNGSTGAFITDTAGNHTVGAALTITPNGVTTTVTAAADTLTISGVVGSDSSADLGLSKGGNGTLALTGANTYFGGTTLNAGTIQINSATSLGDTSGALTFTGGTLQLLGDVTTTRNYQVSGGSNAVIDTNGHALIQNGALAPVNGGSGGLVKNGLGTLTLGGTNTYTGANTINGGVLSVGADASLGVVPAAAANNITINAGALQANASFTLNANRNIILGGTTSTIDTAAGAVLTYAGVMSGSGTLNLTGAGTLVLSNAQNFTGNTTITGATLQYVNGASLPGTIQLNNGGTFSVVSNGTSLFPGNSIFVNAGASATLNSNNVSNSLGTIFTSGDATSILNITGPVSLGATNIKPFATGFTGTVEIPTTSSLRFSSTTLNGGGDNATFDVNGFLTTRNNGAVSLGALSGAGTVTSGTAGSANTTVVYTIGSKAINSSFSGVISNGDVTTGKLTAVVKTGAGTQTFTGTNTYTGATTVNTGTLQIGNGGSSGVISAGAVANNATLAYNRSDVYSVSNTFTGTGTLVFLGSGTKTFTGAVGQGAINASFGTLVIDPTAAGSLFSSTNSSVAPNVGDNATVTVQNNGSYNVSSSNLIVGGQGTGVLNINGITMAGNGATGGVVFLQGGLTIGNSATGVGTVNLNSGGTLNTPTIGTNGGSSTLNLNGGTLVAGSGNPLITGLTAVNVQAGGAIINDGGNTVTIAQVISHDPSLGATADGGLIKSAAGAGILTLAAANTYSGGTTINAGTLAVSVNGGLSTGNVTIASGATLSLSAGVVFAHNNNQTTALTLVDTTSVVNLAAGTGTVQDVVGTLTIGGTPYPAGLYGSSTSGAPFVLPEFTGNGVLDVGIPVAVPEPSTCFMLLIGLTFLGLLAARAKREELV